MSALTQRLYRNWLTSFGALPAPSGGMGAHPHGSEAKRGPGYPARPVATAKSHPASTPMQHLDIDDADSRDRSVALPDAPSRPDKQTAAYAPTRPASEAQTERSRSVGQRGHPPKKKPEQSTNHPGQLQFTSD